MNYIAAAELAESKYRAELRFMRNHIPKRGLAVHRSPHNQGRPRPAPPSQLCPSCGRSHWHPSGEALCVGCELREVGR